jgi:hypothetical protein
MNGDLTRPKSNKGSIDGQFSHEFLHQPAWRGRLIGFYLIDYSVLVYSGTRISIQGGLSSTMSEKRLAVLLAGIPGKTAP